MSLAKTASILRFAEYALSERLLLEEAVFLNKIQGRRPYEGLDFTMDYLRKSANDCAGRLIWC